MAQQEVEARLAVEVSVQRLAEGRGVSLAAEGGALTGHCPFHESEAPTLRLTPSTNRWACEACGEGGPVEWVMRAEGVSRRHAVELLLADGPVSVSTERVKISTVRKLASPVTMDGDDRELLGQVVAYYHQTLKQSPEVLDYLRQRGLVHPEVVEHFRLGFSNRTLGYRLPQKNRQAGAEVRGRLQRIGILRDTGHEHFRGSLVVPVFDEAGGMVQLYGRKVTPNLRPGTPLHTQLPGGPRGVWNGAALGAHPVVILCGSLIDGLTVWCAGYRNVTATLGLEGFTEDHLTALRAHGAERVLLAFRRDEAGERAASAVAERLTAHGISAHRVQLPAGQDVNDFALQAASPTEALGRAFQNAVWMGKGREPTGAAPVDLPLPALPPERADTEARAPGRGQPLSGQPERAPKHGKRSPGTKAGPATPEAAGAPAPTGSPSAPSVPPLAAPAPVMAAPEPLPLVPPAPAAPPIQTEVKDEEVVLHLGDRRYRVRGLTKNTGFDQLKVNLLASREGAHPQAGFHVDTLDLYAARQRAAFIRQAAQELGLAEDVLRHDLGRVLFKLEELQEAALRKALEPKRPEVSLTEEETAEAMELLRAPNLVERITADFARCGVVGEETNRLLGYIAAVSRKLDEPLAVIIQSTSAAGKTSLMEAVLAFVPEEDRVQYSALTGQALYYLGAGDLRHKVLAIAEDVGAEKATYALKLLQSEGALTIASTGKEPSTGRLVTQEYRVEGPVGIFFTTTQADVDEELANRCIVLTVDEDREQTRAIHRLQRERQTLEGVLAKGERERILRLHRNAQRLLRPLLVVNAYAPQLTFLDDRTRTRRDHTKYLTLIRAVALLHQHQRKVKVATRGEREVEYIEATLEDIALANRLAHAVLGHSLDELPPQARRLLGLLDTMVRTACKVRGVERRDYRFHRGEVREATGWTDFQVRTHLKRLVELEYVLVHRGGRGQLFEYELLYDGQGRDGRPFLPGLLDVDALRQRYDGNPEGEVGHSEPAPSPQRGASEPAARAVPDAKSRSGDAGLGVKIATGPADAHPEDASSTPPYPQEAAPEVP